MTIHDPEVYRQYTDRTPPLVEKYGGKFLTRGEDIMCVEGAEYDGRMTCTRETGLPLRGPADAIHPIQALSPVPGTTQWANQPILDQCPAIQAVMDSLHCPLLSVRLLRLGPGAVINEHFDVGLGIDHDELRVHVPIKTNPHIDFRAGGDRVVMEAGTLWYLDAEAAAFGGEQWQHRPYSLGDRLPGQRLDARSRAGRRGSRSRRRCLMGGVAG
ncbi:hypothetical protein GQR58_028507 [Nymphon striatum]|nr:hypothetical protein GQR58_028507 [Nymphon striatum]